MHLIRQLGFFSALFSLAAAAPGHLEPQALERRADLASQEISNIQTLSSDLSTLNGTLNTFTTNDPIGVLEALKIQLQTTQVENAIKAATKTAQQSSNFTSDESTQIANAVVALLPTITGVLNNIVEHKPAFATAILFVGDISKTVEQSLVTQRQLSASFATALAAKLAEPFSSASGIISSQIDSAFQTAIAAYQSCTGLICLPPIPSIP